MPVVEVAHNRQWLSVTGDDGTIRRYPTLWLRDNIPSGRHRTEGQRTFDINRLPADLAILSAELGPDGVLVRFSDAEDVFPLEFFADHPLTGHTSAPTTHWDGSVEFEFVDFARLRADDEVRLDWLRHVRDRGFALARNTPAKEEAVLDVVELFGFVRETNYGRLFNVIATPDPANLANTAIEIGMHTDNPYRDPVPGLQLLHCIVNETDGGESGLCDGFAVAEKLRTENRESFDMLTGTPVRFRYVDAGVADLEHVGPMIETDATGTVTGIRYNSRSVQAFDLPAEAIPDFYVAYRTFAELLTDPANHIRFRLGPGDLVIFDNQRVLHARSAYSVGHRHLQGCYADKDALNSTIRILEAR